jgi:hypothetical protein
VLAVALENTNCYVRGVLSVPLSHNILMIIFLVGTCDLPGYVSLRIGMREEAHSVKRIRVGPNSLRTVSK